MSNQPFFSIVIPTYNRPLSLHNSIKSYLIQDFKQFELLICDNSLNDDAVEVVEHFKDKRIKLYKNKKNIGFFNNIKRGVLAAKGAYIITHGDDDVVLFKNTLSVIYQTIMRKKVGFLRLNILSKDRSNKHLKHIWINQRKNRYIKPNSTALNVVEFLEHINTIFVSGLVFKNEDIHSTDVINSELSPLWNILYKQTKKNGGFFLSQFFIVASWSGPKKNIYIDKKTKQLFFEHYFNHITKLLHDSKGLDHFKQHFYNKITAESRYILPAIKYIASNKDVDEYMNALKKFNPSIAQSISVKIPYQLSKLLPKYIIGIIRNNIHLIRNDTELTLSDIATKKTIAEINSVYLRIVSSH